MLLSTGSIWAASPYFMDPCISHIRGAFEMHEVHPILKLLAQKSCILSRNKFSEIRNKKLKIFTEDPFQKLYIFFFF